MAVVTYLIRAIPLVCMNKKIQNRFVQSFLHYVPYTCLAAMTVPAIFYATQSMISAIIGFMVALFFAYKENSLVFVAATGCFAVFMVEGVLYLI